MQVVGDIRDFVGDVADLSLRRWRTILSEVTAGAMSEGRVVEWRLVSGDALSDCSSDWRIPYLLGHFLPRSWLRWSASCSR